MLQQRQIVGIVVGAGAHVGNQGIDQGRLDLALIVGRRCHDRLAQAALAQHRRQILRGVEQLGQAHEIGALANVAGAHRQHDVEVGVRLLEEPHQQADEPVHVRPAPRSAARTPPRTDRPAAAAARLAPDAAYTAQRLHLVHGQPQPARAAADERLRGPRPAGRGPRPVTGGGNAGSTPGPARRRAAGPGASAGSASARRPGRGSQPPGPE